MINLRQKETNNITQLNDNNKPIDLMLMESSYQYNKRACPTKKEPQQGFLYLTI